MDREFVAVREASPRETAVFLACVLGGVGAHKFFMGRRLQGWLCVLFFWSFVPALLGLGEGLYYWSLTDGAFDRLCARRHGAIREVVGDTMALIAVLTAPRDLFIVTERQSG